MEIRRQTDVAMRRARDVIIEAHEDFKSIFGRGGDPFLEEYMTDDADVVLVGMGTLSLPLKVTVRRMREKGQKVGFIRIKWFRPFPTNEIRETLSRFKAVGVIDRDYSLGSPLHGGVLFNDIRSAMYSMENRVPIIGFIAGLGGREITIRVTREMYDITQKVAERGEIDEEIHWMGVRK